MPKTDPVLLCPVESITENGCRGLYPDNANIDEPLFIVRQGDKIFGYINRCPHTGAPLEWMPNQFLSLDGQYIQCGLHGARFEIDSGLCIDGPCIAQSLTPIVVKVSDGKVLWEIKPGG